MRRMSLVAGAVLTIALVLGALPPMTGSRVLTIVRPVQADAFRVVPGSSGKASIVTVDPPDPANDSANRLDPAEALIEPGLVAVPLNRPVAAQPEPSAGRLAIPRPTPKLAPRLATTATATTATTDTGTIAGPHGAVTQTLVGSASWYDNGTTAARLPRGTLIRICGAAACVERIVTDYGPQQHLTGRVVDLMPGDFRRVCGCPASAGLTKVTVYVYGR